jgi:hypothetical protein
VCLLGLCCRPCEPPGAYPSGSSCASRLGSPLTVSAHLPQSCLEEDNCSLARCGINTDYWHSNTRTDISAGKRLPCRGGKLADAYRGCVGLALKWSTVLLTLQPVYCLSALKSDYQVRGRITLINDDVLQWARAISQAISRERWHGGCTLGASWLCLHPQIHPQHQQHGWSQSIDQACYKPGTGYLWQSERHAGAAPGAAVISLR